MSFATERGKGFFVREYEELGKSISRIAKEQSVTSTTIRKALISYNIERRQTSKLSDHEKETILSMTESGHSVVEISNVISRSQQAVRSVLSPQQRIKPPIDKHTLYEEYVDNGMSGPELATKYNVNTSTVYNWLTAYDIPRTNTPFHSMVSKDILIDLYLHSMVGYPCMIVELVNTY